MQELRGLPLSDVHGSLICLVDLGFRRYRGWSVVPNLLDVLPKVHCPWCDGLRAIHGLADVAAFFRIEVLITHCTVLIEKE